MMTTQFSTDETAVYSAASNNNLNALKNALEINKESANHANAAGLTPLFIASLKGHAACVGLLLEAGADFSIAAKFKLMDLYPLVLAPSQQKILHQLLQKKYGLVTENSEIQITAREIAKIMGHATTYLLLKDKENGKKISIFNAARHGNLDLLKVALTMNPSSINASNFYGLTPIFIAAQRGNLDCVKLLIEQGANFNCNCLIQASHFLSPPLNGEAQAAARSFIQEKYGVVNKNQTIHMRPAEIAQIMGHVAVQRLLEEKEQTSPYSSEESRKKILKETGFDELLRSIKNKIAELADRNYPEASAEASKLYYALAKQRSLWITGETTNHTFNNMCAAAIEAATTSSLADARGFLKLSNKISRILVSKVTFGLITFAEPTSDAIEKTNKIKESLRKIVASEEQIQRKNSQPA